jgi:hypothetical protein
MNYPYLNSLLWDGARRKEIGNHHSVKKDCPIMLAILGDGLLSINKYLRII